MTEATIAALQEENRKLANGNAAHLASIAAYDKITLNLAAENKELREALRALICLPAQATPEAAAAYALAAKALRRTR